MKVLFLTRYPREGASSRYRVYQYVSHLEALGVICHVQSFMDSAMYELSFAPGRTAAKMLATAMATGRRLHALARFRRYDVIYMQRELFPFGPPLLERLMRALGAVLVFDYDDALFITKPSRFNVLATLFRSPGKVLTFFGLVDGVIAGNDYLRDVAMEHGARAFTVEVAEDTERIQMHPPHRNRTHVLIGWLGSTSTVKYLRLIEGALRLVAARYPSVQFEIVGGGDFALEGLPATHTQWSLGTELEALRRFDIGIMPLPMESWSKGKSGGKARTYMAAGVPPVCARIGYNMELIRHGETGFLCETEEDWVEALSRLIEDPQLRQRIAVAARREVEERFSLPGQAAKLYQAISEIALSRPADARAG